MIRECNMSIQESNDDMMHFGIPSMKWGVRRYQNKDGTLTSAGRKRLGRDAVVFSLPQGHMMKLRSKKKVANRLQVINDYNEKNNTRRGYSILGMPINDLAPRNGKQWTNFLNKYSEATLQDLNFEVTDEARNFVKNLVAFNYGWYDESLKSKTK